MSLSRARESDAPLHVAGRRVKKFSGLQMKIWKKLFIGKVHPHGMDSARSPSSDCMSGLCLSRLSEINMALRAGGSVCGSTVDKHRPDRNLALKDCAPGIPSRKIFQF
jgi:hypothetical protein